MVKSKAKQKQHNDTSSFVLKLIEINFMFNETEGNY